MGIHTDVSWSIAFIAGLASFLSPCLLPMIPAYIMYMAGASMAENEAISRKKALIRTLFFVIGFTCIFLLLGLSASALGRVFITHKLIFQRVAGALIVLLGLQFMGVFKLPIMGKHFGPRLQAKGNSGVGAFLMGLSFGAGWTPCFGPVLASILVMASATQSATEGVMLLLVYALGLAVPFVMTAVFINEATGLVEKMTHGGVWIQRVSGLILIIFGVLMAMNWLVKLNFLF